MKRALLILALLIFPSITHAAIGFGGISAVSTSQTPTSVVVAGANTIGFVCVAGETASDQITAVTWNSVSMTKIRAVQVPGDRWMSLWYIVNPASATTISFTGGTFWRSFSSYYTGASQTGQPDSSNSGTVSSNTAISVSTTVVAANSWYMMCGKNSTGGGVYTPSGVLASTRADNDGGGIFIGDSNTTVGTGSQSGTMTKDGGAANQAAIAVSIAAAAAVVNSAPPQDIISFE